MEQDAREGVEPADARFLEAREKYDSEAPKVTPRCITCHLPQMADECQKCLLCVAGGTAAVAPQDTGTLVSMAGLLVKYMMM